MRKRDTSKAPCWLWPPKGVSGGPTLCETQEEADVMVEAGYGLPSTHPAAKEKLSRPFISGRCNEEQWGNKKEFVEFIRDDERYAKCKVNDRLSWKDLRVELIDFENEYLAR